MQSLLTRQVIRKMTHQALCIDTRYLYRPTKRRCLHWHNAFPTTLYLSQKRTLFGFSFKPKRRPKPANFKPGVELMLNLDKMLKIGERPPPTNELAEAFVSLFKSHQTMDGAYSQLEDAQIGIAISTFKHLQKMNSDMDRTGISTESLRMALRILDRGSSKAHKQMATLIFEELNRRRQKEDSSGREEFGPFYADLLLYITVLCQSDGALHARALVEQYWESDFKAAKVVRHKGTREKTFDVGSSAWMRVLRGFIRERLGDEVETTIQIMQKHHVPFDSQLHATVVSFYAHVEGNMEMTKKWYRHPIIGDGLPTNAADLNVLKLCIRNDDLEWGEPILAKLTDREPQDKMSLNVILQWAAAKGRGVDEIDDMMKLMDERYSDKPSLHSNMDTINALIEFATMRDDPYTAERYYALGEKRGFQPNTRTYLFQLEYRIKVKDLSGAMTAYRCLQAEDLSNNEDIPYTNKLIVAFCAQADLRYEIIMSLVEDLTERKAPFYPETISALSLLHLDRGEIMDLSDLLNTYTFNYSLAERISIHRVLFARAIAVETSVFQAWELYKTLCAVFPELMTRTSHVQIMTSFFARKRPDIVITVFAQLFKQRDQALRPNTDIYCTTLVGLSQFSNLTAVESIHNMMKVDVDIEPNTKLYNAFMIAFTSQGRADAALWFWAEISHSREGPNFSSIQLVLKACARSMFGEELAREIWQKMNKENVEITREVFAAYIGALAGHNRFNECVNLLASSEEMCGTPVDVLILGNYYNGATSQVRRDQIKDFVQHEYPTAYANLLNCNMKEFTIYDQESISDGDEDPIIIRQEMYYDLSEVGGHVDP